MRLIGRGGANADRVQCWNNNIFSAAGLQPFSDEVNRIRRGMVSPVKYRLHHCAKQSAVSSV